MRPTLVLMMALAAAAASAQTPRRQACELLSVADVEAAIGVSPLRSFDQQKTGRAADSRRKVIDYSSSKSTLNTSTLPMPTPSPGG